MKQNKEEKGSEIKQLLLLLGSAIGVALVVSAFLILHYGPSGEYYVKNILLAPEIMEQVNYRDGTKGESQRFIFDRVEFRYFDDQTRSWKTRVLNREVYRDVYKILENQSSLSTVSEEILNQFNLPNPATLTLYVKNENTTIRFQEVIFVNNGEVYRVMLRNDAATPSWAYFSQRNIYDHVLHIIQDVDHE